MNPKLVKNKFGFTFIELVIYLALVSGILVTATSFAWNIINSRAKAFAVQEVAQNGRFISERLVHEMHQAVDIVEPQPSQTSDHLLLAMRDEANNPIDFTVVDGTLFISQHGDEPIALSSDQVILRELRIVNLGTQNTKSQNVKIVFELEHINPENRQEWQAAETFVTAVELRDNY